MISKCVKKNLPVAMVSITHFSAFRYVIKHSLLCFIYYFLACQFTIYILFTFYLHSIYILLTSFCFPLSFLGLATLNIFSPVPILPRQMLFYQLLQNIFAPSQRWWNIRQKSKKTNFVTVIVTSKRSKAFSQYYLF